jgi:5'-nucleotidase
MPPVGVPLPGSHDACGDAVLTGSLTYATTKTFASNPAGTACPTIRSPVKILLTNDDGIYAPGLAAMEAELSEIGEVTVVAPATEQSGVGHAITFLTPLVCERAYAGDRCRGWSVEGSPADCVKLGVVQLLDEKPDLVVSGMNNGLNVGINVLYSGTVAAAIEGAFFGVTSIAVSLEYEDRSPNFTKAAPIARQLIEQILEHGQAASTLYNINIPLQALSGTPRVDVVPMGKVRYGEQFEKRTSPQGREYYWATGNPAPCPSEVQDDLQAITRGDITVTPLSFDLTNTDALPATQAIPFQVKADR